MAKRAGGAASVVEYLIAQGVPTDTKNDHGETAMKLADDQEVFRYKRDIEGRGGISVKNPTRSTATTDAFKRAMQRKMASR